MFHGEHRRKRMSNKGHPILLYDVEILRPPPDKKREPEPDIEYAEGWTDYKGMDFTMVSAYSYVDQFPRIFFRDNIDEFFQLLNDHEIFAGFNNIAFDNPLIEELFGIEISDEQSFDILLEIREAAGVNKFAKGYNLNNTTKVNLGVGKSGEGAQAPILWQRKRYGSVADYGLRDIWLTKGIMDMILEGTPLLDPGSPTDRIFVKSPV